MMSVDGAQHVAVVGDGLLGAVARLRLLLDQVFYPLVSRLDALDAVGRLSALDDGDLPERLERLRRLLLVELLTPAVFAQVRRHPQEVMRERQRSQVVGLERLHARASSSARSINSGFRCRMRRSFFSRRHFLSCFSRAMASRTWPYSS